MNFKNIAERITVQLMTAASAVMLLGSSVAAQTNEELLCEGSGGTWNGETCTPRDGQALFGGDDSLFVSITNTLIFLVGAISVIMIIIGGIRYVVSGGDQNAVTGAKNTILYAIVGIVVSVLAYALVNFVITQL